MRRGRIFYGWWIVSACAALNLYIGGVFFYGFGAFFDPIRTSFGWSYAAVSFANSLQRLQGGIGAPVVGFIFDKVGPRKLMFFGVSVAGLGFLFLSHISSLWTYYLAFLLISLGFSTGGAGIAMATVVNWFIRRRTLAVALMMTGFGLSGTLVPVVLRVIDAIGWRDTLLYIGIGVWVVGFPIAAMMKHRPEKHGLLPDGDTVGTEPPTSGEPDILEQSVTAGARWREVDFTVREALRTRAFWLIGLTYTIQVLGTSAIFVHVIPHLTLLEMRSISGYALAGMTVMSLVGRLGFGWLGDIKDKRYLLVITLALQCVGILLLANVSTWWHLIPFLIAYSPAYGGPIPMRPAIIGEYFGRKAFGAIQGLMHTVTIVGGIIGPIFAGWTCDLTGNYHLGFMILAFTSLAAIPAILAAKRPTLDRVDEVTSVD
ncbi:MAG: MFS transporter [Chloroflexota bacterium]